MELVVMFTRQNIFPGQQFQISDGSANDSEFPVEFVMKVVCVNVVPMCQLRKFLDCIVRDESRSIELDADMDGEFDVNILSEMYRFAAATSSNVSS